ncbi:unnamed protein product [Peniophora sp. CBMAI 1063]|nr:unnamed protein product [Peniophora sp. CBMAI 1063]
MPSPSASSSPPAVAPSQTTQINYYPTPLPRHLALSSRCLSHLSIRTSSIHLATCASLLERAEYHPHAALALYRIAFVTAMRHSSLRHLTTSPFRFHVIEATLSFTHRIRSV